MQIDEKIATKYPGDSKTGYGKGLMDAARSESEVIVETKPL